MELPCWLVSFAVPIKSARVNQIHVDPLVIQTYKTVMCFLTCWLILLFEEHVTFTSWGLLSGLFWVPGGTAGIYAVRSPVGLAVSQSIWSSLKLLVAFIWGVLIFHESVRSKIVAMGAILLMMFGLCGMSLATSTSKGANHNNNDDPPPSITMISVIDESEDVVETIQPHRENLNGDKETSSDLLDDNDLSAPLLSAADDDVARLLTDTNTEDGARVLVLESEEDHLDHSESSIENQDEKKSLRLGYLCAVIDGAYGGSILVPLHYAKLKSDSLGFVMSFAIGALTILLMIWILRFSYALFLTRSVVLAYQGLPGFHFSVMWLPGGLAGLLWSIGNICSIICVANLGEGVGYSIVQSQMLVAGLWGVFYYREVQGFNRTLCWLSFAVVTIVGVLLLSHEHIRHTKL